VKFRAGAAPVLYLSNPPGLDREARRRFLDDLNTLNRAKLEETGDPEISTRIAQYEMAFRMQTSVPELTDLSKEPASTFDRYGPDSRIPGTYAANVSERPMQADGPSLSGAGAGSEGARAAG
jgi:hypothetical protein